MKGGIDEEDVNVDAEELCELDSSGGAPVDCIDVATGSLVCMLVV